MSTTKLGRNDPCHCGSGQKYKKCCATKDEAARSRELSAQAAARAEAAALAEGEPGTAPKELPNSAQRPGVNAGARLSRPKLPTPRTSSLPRRGAV
jgi:hypothetical protein